MDSVFIPSAGILLLAHDGAGAGTPARLILLLTMILLLAKLSGELATRLGQSAVLGELFLGIFLGNLVHLGFRGLEQMPDDPVLNSIAGLGALLLVFQLGLMSTVSQMLQVGPSALLVALIGTTAPFLLGWGVSAWCLPGSSPFLHLYLGATLTATGVVVIGRFLRDLGRERTLEARVILGAAVIDDALGFVILAAVSGLILAAESGSSFSAFSVALIVVKAIAFLGLSIALGVRLSPWLLSLATHLESRGVLLTAGLVFCFFLSYLASRIGLEPIVGAFAAGLILESAHCRGLLEKGEKPLEESIEPIAQFLVPIFFVLMGAKVNLASLAVPGTLGLLLFLALAAVAGKIVCSLGVTSKEIDRIAVGIGMVPMGAVGLIFAQIGLTLTVDGKPLITPAIYSAVVLLVLITTLVTLPLLKWRLDRIAPKDPGV